MGTLAASLILLCISSAKVEGGRFCDIPSPRLCADDCDGNGYYLNDDETECLACPTCEQGQELNKPCGNGINGDAVCIPCREGYFSSTGSRVCMPCRACTNTVQVNNCEPTRDRQCGTCLPGYVKRGGRFAADPDACPDKCLDLPRDTPQCQDWWSQYAEADGGGDEAGNIGEGAPDDQVPVVPLDDYESCEPVPPRCADVCHDDRYYLGSDGLCKMCQQCQPGEELDKNCGNGKHGDALCRRCPDGTFSVDGRRQCIPCRICVNSVITTECSATSDRECGDCLPGFHQAAANFPDPNACPNSCGECPNEIPQCQEWCKKVAESIQILPPTQTGPLRDSAEFEDQDNAVDDRGDPALSESFPIDTEDKTVDEKASVSMPHHSSYLTIITILASLIIALLVVFVVSLLIVRYFLKRPSDSESVTQHLMQDGSQGTPSPGNSPEVYSHRRVYSDTVTQNRPSGRHTDNDRGSPGPGYGDEQQDAQEGRSHNTLPTHKVFSENERGHSVPYQGESEDVQADKPGVRRRSSASSTDSNGKRPSLSSELNQFDGLGNRRRSSGSSTDSNGKRHSINIEPIPEILPEDSSSINNKTDFDKEDSPVDITQSKQQGDQSLIPNPPNGTHRTLTDTPEEDATLTISGNMANPDRRRVAPGEDQTAKQEGSTGLTNIITHITNNFNVNVSGGDPKVLIGDEHTHYEEHAQEPLLKSQCNTKHSACDEEEDGEGGYEEESLLDGKTS